MRPRLSHLGVHLDNPPRVRPVGGLYLPAHDKSCPYEEAAEDGKGEAQHPADEADHDGVAKLNAIPTSALWAGDGSLFNARRITYEVFQKTDLITGIICLVTETWGGVHRSIGARDQGACHHVFDIGKGEHWRGYCG